MKTGQKNQRINGIFRNADLKERLLPNTDFFEYFEHDHFFEHNNGKDTGNNLCKGQQCRKPRI